MEKYTDPLSGIVIENREPTYNEFADLVSESQRLSICLGAGSTSTAASHVVDLYKAQFGIVLDHLYSKMRDLKGRTFNYVGD